MTATATQQPANEAPGPVRIRMWQSYDDGGWQSLEEHDYERAKKYFTKAVGYASTFPDSDYRHGRTMAGLAWAEYRLAQIASADQTALDPSAVYGSLAERADDAVKRLEQAELNRLDRQCLARAQHLLGLLRVELCQGTAAEASLERAASLYRETELDDPYFEVVQLRAKLNQCRRNFHEAARHFQRIYDEAGDAERRFSALIDLANTWLWLGRVREAWQLRFAASQLIGELELLPDERLPKDALFRGQLVFARVHLLYGDFAGAAQWLESAEGRICSCDEISSVCRAVFWIVSAELASHRGDLRRVMTCLDEFHRVVHSIKQSRQGYACLEVVAIDAACQVCVVEICCCEIVRRTCCRRRWGCRRVMFTDTVVRTTTIKTERHPIDFAKVLAEIVNAIRARMESQTGQLATSELLTRSSIACIETEIHTHSPLLIPMRLLLAEVLVAKKESPVKFRQQLKMVSEIVQALGASASPTRAVRDRLLAAWHAQLSEYDLAEDLYAAALRHSLNCRSDGHPDHLMTQVEWIAAGAVVIIGSGEWRGRLRKRSEAVWSLVEQIRSTVACFDDRVGLAIAVPPWLSLLTGCFSSAEGGFCCASNYWVERIVALGLPHEDPRQAEPLLGGILAAIELGGPPDEQAFASYRRLATREVGVPMVAFELNRTGMLMLEASLCDAARYCFEKSIELYPSQDYSGFHPTACDNLERIASRAMGN